MSDGWVRGERESQAVDGGPGAVQPVPGRVGRRLAHWSRSRGGAMDATLRELTDFTVYVLDNMVRPEFPAEAVLEFLRPAMDAPTAVFQRTQRESGDTINIADGVPSDGVASIIERSKAQWRMNALMAGAARGELVPTTIQRAI